MVYGTKRKNREKSVNEKHEFISSLFEFTPHGTSTHAGFVVAIALIIVDVTETTFYAL